jgi:tRNA uridine 5-carboxymethylaminomethyl modification enzyme
MICISIMMRIRRTAYDLLAYQGDRPEAAFAVFGRSFRKLTVKLPKLLEIEAQYAVYMDRQSADVASIRKEEARQIPADADFAMIPGLSNELRQKLALRKPQSVADAQRIDGMTPAALALVIMEIRRLESLTRGAA